MKHIKTPKSNNKTMNKQILIFIMGIFLLASVSALYSGESITIDLGQDYEYYYIVGNSSEVNLSIEQNGTLITITPNKYSVDDTYEIIFFDEVKETITVYRGGGGRSRTRYVDRNITEYKNITKEVEKIIEVEVTGKDRILEKLVEISESKRGTNILIGCLLLIILGLLLWNFKKSETHEYINRAEKEVKQYE
jgi:hypothetical protein